MSSRRKHSKSRHGCLQCKAAHVKCDLGQPTCGKCMKTGKACQFQNLVDGRFSNTTFASYHQGHVKNPPVLTLLRQERALITPENVLSDELELMHHFSIVTSQTMGNRKDLCQMWQIQVPKLALKHRYLKHSLFSITALHMALSHPENQSVYIDRAIRYYNICLPEFTLTLQHITQENCTSLFICAALTIVFAFNLPILRPHEEPTSPIEEMSGIFTLLRGIPFVMGGMCKWLRESEIAPLFIGRSVDKSIVLSDDIIDALKRLEVWNQLTSKSESEKDTYTRAIKGLKEGFMVIASKDGENGMVLGWPIQVGQEFVAFLRSRQPMALVLLAYFAVLLDEIRDTWWVMGWGRKLIQELNQAVVDDEWKSLMVWPMDKIAMGK